MKKAQITLFVIIGLSLVLVAAILIVITQTSTPPGEETTVAITHEFVEVVNTYHSGAEQCLLTEGTLVFQRIMSQGGHFDTTEASLFSFPQRTTSGNAVSFGNHLIPFWLEQRSSARCTNNCPIRFNIPSLTQGTKSIESQASTALTKRVASCLESIVFGQDYEAEKGEPQVKVTIGENMITYSLNWPVTFTYQPTGATRNEQGVTARQQSSLKPMYEIGKSLLYQLETANQTAILPRLTDVVIRSYAMGQGAIPPIDGGASFSTSMKSWYLPTVKSELSTYLADNIPLVRVKGSRSDSLFLDENYYSQAIYHGDEFNPDLVLPYANVVPRLSIDLVYLPTWDIDLHVEPSKGYLIAPDFTSLSFIPGIRFGVADYRFSYNLIYPVMVVVHDPEAFDGQGLSLIYAFETGLRNNQPLLYSSYDEDELYEEEFFQNELFFDSGLVTVSTADALTNTSLTNVSVDYVCGTSAVNLGTTTTSQDGFSRTSGFLPPCLGGLVLASKEGYSFLPAPLSITDEEPHVITMKGYVEKEFSLNIQSKMVVKMPVINDNGFIAGYEWILGNTTIGNLGPDNEVMYFITHKEPLGDGEVQTGSFYPATQERPIIKLVPGEYDVELMVITRYGENRTQESFTIPSREECHSTGILGLGGDECFTIPEIVFDEVFFAGSLNLIEELDTVMNVSVDDYANSTTLTLYVLEVDTSSITIAEDLEVLDLLDDLVVEHHDDLLPVFT